MDNLNNQLNVILKPLFENSYFISFLGLFLALYAGMLAPALPNRLIYFFDTQIGKLLFVFIIAFFASRSYENSLQISLITTLIFFITLVALDQQAIRENFYDENLNRLNSINNNNNLQNNISLIKHSNENFINKTANKIEKENWETFQQMKKQQLEIKQNKLRTAQVKTDCAADKAILQTTLAECNKNLINSKVNLNKCNLVTENLSKQLNKCNAELAKFTGLRKPSPRNKSPKKRFSPKSVSPKNQQQRSPKRPVSPRNQQRPVSPQQRSPKRPVSPSRNQQQRPVSPSRNQQQRPVSPSKRRQLVNNGNRNSRLPNGINRYVDPNLSSGIEKFFNSNQEEINGFMDRQEFAYF